MPRPNEADPGALFLWYHR